MSRHEVKPDMTAHCPGFDDDLLWAFPSNETQCQTWDDTGEFFYGLLTFADLKRSCLAGQMTGELCEHISRFTFLAVYMCVELCRCRKVLSPLSLAEKQSLIVDRDFDRQFRLGRLVFLC